MDVHPCTYRIFYVTTPQRKKNNNNNNKLQKIITNYKVRGLWKAMALYNNATGQKLQPIFPNAKSILSNWQNYIVFHDFTLAPELFYIKGK